MARYHYRAHFLLMIVPFLSGCRREVESPPVASPPKKQPTSSEVLGYTIEQLSSIGGYLPELDEGRLKVAPPVDWHMAPRSRDYVARFVFDRSRRLTLPRITVDACEADEEDPHNLTKESLASYVKSMAGRMDEELLQVLEGEVGLLMLGDVPCARYVLRKKFRLGENLIRADREVLLTIRDGRIYRVLLDVHSGTLREYRADAYAVMATMKYPLAGPRDDTGAGEETERDDEASQDEQGVGELPADEPEAASSDDGKEAV